MEHSLSNPLIAVAIIEAVTDQRFADVIQDAIFTPLGMENSGHMSAASDAATVYRGEDVVEYDASNYPYLLYSTVNDLMLYEEAIENDTLLTQSQFEPVQVWHQAIEDGEIPYGYGYGWFLNGGENHWPDR